MKSDIQQFQSLKSKLLAERKALQSRIAAIDSALGGEPLHLRVFSISECQSQDIGSFMARDKNKNREGKKEEELSV